ncbi:hypothetical protein [Parendozoicomonas sp. Alg238-R29]|uniref:hypothetical protein n=1 Tax=Parendozoicomonas sp. Alg238-R29 TaxID=2993446 RepID=UPI00248DCE5F|nr:hypothetical protein [Parendozoicomonas sp. Alg238-R29]
MTPDQAELSQSNLADIINVASPLLNHHGKTSSKLTHTYVKLERLPNVSNKSNNHHQIQWNSDIPVRQEKSERGDMTGKVQYFCVAVATGRE